MKTLVVYSSLSGNTKYIAKGIYEAIKGEKDLVDLKDAKNWQDYDRLYVGYWVDKGGPNTECKKFLEEISGKEVAVFATLGVNPSSEHAETAIQRGIDLVKAENKVIGSFICQGRLSKEIMERLKKMPKDNFHYPTPERLKAWEISSVHPNEEDIKNALEAFQLK